MNEAGVASLYAQRAELVSFPQPQSLSECSGGTSATMPVGVPAELYGYLDEILNCESLIWESAISYGIDFSVHTKLGDFH
jgi:hypothetical protein